MLFFFFKLFLGVSAKHCSNCQPLLLAKYLRYIYDTILGEISRSGGVSSGVILLCIIAHSSLYVLSPVLASPFTFSFRGLSLFAGKHVDRDVWWGPNTWHPNKPTNRWGLLDSFTYTKEPVWKNQPLATMFEGGNSQSENVQRQERKDKNVACRLFKRLREIPPQNT